MTLNSSHNWTEIAIRLGLAVLLGAAIGLNRDLHNKPAGLRTHALVSLGAALIVLTAARASGPADAAGVTRVIQGIITGVGFIGAGVILRPAGTEDVRGLTTASTIWVVACLGSACGAGEWPIALFAFLLVVVILIFGGPTERLFHRYMSQRDPSAKNEADALNK
jgi:putative Mg2+ transporter-C (MgtC) family protein